MIKHLLLFLLLLSLSAHPARSQDTASLQKGEKELVRLFRQMHGEKQDRALLLLNDSVTTLFQEILKEPASFSYPFDSLRYAGRIYPPDTSFRIINWNLSLSGGRFRYYGFILLKDSLNRTSRLIRLEDHTTEISHPQDTVLTPSSWYGALYYDILLNRWEGNNYYTLLGITFHDMFTTRKVIDVLTFDKEGNIFFGAPLFATGEKIHDRIIFEFSARVSMLLHYDSRLGMIVFDHLSPSHPRYEGIYQFYGPDSSYDGFAFYNGMWHLKKDLDVRNIHMENKGTF